MFSRQQLKFDKSTRFLIQGWIKIIHNEILNIPRLVSTLIYMYYKWTDEWKTIKGEGNIDFNGMRISTISTTFAVGRLKFYQHSRKRYEWTLHIERGPEPGHGPMIKIGFKEVSKKGVHFCLMSDGAAIHQYNTGGVLSRVVLCVPLY